MIVNSCFIYTLYLPEGLQIKDEICRMNSHHGPVKDEPEKEKIKSNKIFIT